MLHIQQTYVAALLDAELKCGVDLGDERFFVQRSVADHGLGFYTLALPRLGSLLEEGLECGRLPEYANRMRVFGRRGRGPKFLSGLFRLVFDPDGYLLDEPSVEAISSIRQLSYMFKKAKAACSKQRTYAAIKQFVHTDRLLATDFAQYDAKKGQYLRALARRITSACFSDLSEDIATGVLLPRHGPGATAEKLLPNGRYDLRYWHERLEEYFPAADFIAPNYSFWLSHCDGVRFVSSELEQPVRVVTVPKTQKTPRVIAIEPSAMQYAQQALQSGYRDALSRFKRTRPVFNWEDQTVNRERARLGSVDGAYATLDLSEASDRVSLCLVETLHEAVPELLGAMLACRSLRAEVPNFGVIPLRKFASMGSAMCFPVEAFCFYAIATAAIMHSRGLSPYDDCEVDVTVYGDDIIIPVDETPVVIEWLHAFGMKVNLTKSFSSGRFRESCGGDYVAGDDVTVAYCRVLEQPTRRTGDALSSWVAFRNHMYERGWWSVVKTVDRLLRKNGCKVPHQPTESPGVFLQSFRNWATWGRWSKTLHRLKMRCLMIRPSWRRDEHTLLGWLMHFFLQAESSKGSGPRETCIQQSQSVRRGDVTLYHRWI